MWGNFQNIQCDNTVGTALPNSTVTPSPDTRKLLRNGQLFILCDGVEYNAQGQIVKE